QAHFIDRTDKSELKDWKSFFEKVKTEDKGKEAVESTFGYEKNILNDSSYLLNSFLQLHNTYIIAATQNGFLLVHQQLAHERVQYEKY
ncbi:hypothetical protein ABTM07_20085, partial [Acinetobacter baumannii]